VRLEGRVVLVTALLAGCFSSGSKTCADGTLCPPGFDCAPAGGGCIDPFQRCGNGVVDPGEVCDDGPNNPTCREGGCSADCKKIEVCGDGFVDCGEQCDDANANPADGCDHCVATGWVATAIVAGDPQALAFALNGPFGVAIDAAGLVYIADSNAHRVRRVDPASHAVTTVAGTGFPGFSGDFGPATSAQLDQPDGVAVDGFGNVFIADTQNNVIRRVDVLTGIITTVAGVQGPGGFSGDAGPALAAQLNQPEGLAVDGLGDLFVADSRNNRIRRIDTQSGVVTTVAGNGVLGFSGDGGAATSAAIQAPLAIAVDAGRNLYIADTNNSRIRRVDAGTQRIATVAGSATSGFAGDGGPATSAQLNTPRGIAIDAGNLYIADTFNQRIRRVDTTGMITTYATTAATAIAVDASASLYASDPSNDVVYKVDPARNVSAVAGVGVQGLSGDGGLATSAPLGSLQTVALDAAGNVFVADSVQHRVRRVDAATGVITTVAGTGVGGFSGDAGLATTAQLNAPLGVAVDGTGNVFIADTNNDRVRRVDALTSVITTVAGTGSACIPSTAACGDAGTATSAQLTAPSAVAIDGAGNLYIADTGDNRIRRVSGGTITTVVGTGTPCASGACGDGGAATSAQLQSPAGIAIAPGGDLVIADPVEQRVRRVSAGTITTVAGNGTQGSAGDGGAATSAQLNTPNSVAVDASGTLYVADTGNHRIRRIVAGTITTVVATGTAGNIGDGGVATSAELAGPKGIGVDAAGDLYVADTGNHRIRRVDHATARISSVAGQVDPANMGALSVARLADPRAIVVATAFELIGGGTSGTIQAVRNGQVEVVAGQYPQTSPTSNLARYRTVGFGAVGGVAYDDASGTIYMTESTANRLQAVAVVDPNDPTTWTIGASPFAGDVAGSAGFADGTLAAARFANPTGLYLDQPAQILYVADTDNHVIRAIDLARGMVSTIAGRPQAVGFFGDGGPATNALLFKPHAITRCGNGDLFVADTGNHRVRRIDATNAISTVVGYGVAASSGDGSPATAFPVDTPLGLVCDAIGNLLVTSRTSVRMLPWTTVPVIDGTGRVETIYPMLPYTISPSATSCLTGIANIDATTVRVTDSCGGMLIELQRQPKP
jgi:sugar lactone lactonase YvrE